MTPKSVNLSSMILLSAQSAEAGTWRLQIGVVCIAIPYYWKVCEMLFYSIIAGSEFGKAVHLVPCKARVILSS